MCVALAGSGMSIMPSAALSEGKMMKKRYEETIKDVTGLLTKLYGEFGGFEVAYSDNSDGGILKSREDYKKRSKGHVIPQHILAEILIEYIEDKYGVKLHPYKPTIVLPTHEAHRKYLYEGYKCLNEMAKEGAPADKIRSAYKVIQAATETLKNLDLNEALTVAHEIGHKAEWDIQPKLLEKDFKAVSEGVATAIGFVYLLNKVKKGDFKREEVLDVIEKEIEFYRHHLKNDEHRLGLYVLDDFDTHAEKSVDEMMEYLNGKVSIAIKDPSCMKKQIEKSAKTQRHKK